MTEHVLLQGEYLDAATELRAIALERKDLATREAECKRIIEKHLAVGDRGVTPDGEEIITVRAGARRFDAGLSCGRYTSALATGEGLSGLLLGGLGILQNAVRVLPRLVRGCSPSTAGTRQVLT